MPYPALNVLCIEKQKQKQEFGCGEERKVGSQWGGCAEKETKTGQAIMQGGQMALKNRHI